MAGNLAGADPKFKEIITSLDDDKIDMLAATSVLQQKATDIRNQKVNWQSYFQSQMISQEDFNFIVAFDVNDSQNKVALLRRDRTQAAQTLLNLLGHVSKDQTLQYILVLVDDMLQEDRSRVEIFHEYATLRKEPMWAPFLNLLNRQDGFITNMTSRIIAKIACWSHTPMERSDLHFYLTWLKDQLKSQELKNKLHAAKMVPKRESRGCNSIIAGANSILFGMSLADATRVAQENNEYIQSVARCLQMMLRIDDYRFAFVSVDGISTLLSVLAGRVNFQVQYQLIFCLWVLTFNPLLAEKMNKFNVIPILADILSDSVKEKVTRIILAVFRNLIEKPEDAQVAKEHCISMVQSKVLKQLQILEQRKCDDEDITADVEFLSEKLHSSVQDLSSFDEYATEVKSGRLEWSPVHKSKFWRENAQRLNEKNYELLRILIHLLETSKDPLVLSVASFDIGEYVRHYPRGKHVIEQLGGKTLVMQLLGHEDPNVRYEALLAVQKLMVHNWEYLGRQLEQDTGADKGVSKGGSQVAGKAHGSQVHSTSDDSSVTWL
ncbi:V-type proton ATPase subunit H isoform X1 [Dendroctonus ponderosae]|uniref:ATPase V1 complex subunit H C-terminal domain-containing protein n=1 Tax=Dendroctonus ponderosae TaxID=77166 RepID=A0AAR5PDD2_DENPD|nr:V-type proton ATPase subunit H isoform X1 [Dendroctonus ponderosae]XP_019758702.1 V-type proton ATPase subunit H isoform X1 [Dendroctonus ponderosae]